MASPMAAVRAQAKRSITDSDLYAFRWIANPQISPDGLQVAYTVVRVSAKHDGYETSLAIVPAGGGPSRQLTAGPRDGGAVWAPDGKSIAFVRAVEKDGKRQPQIFLLPMDGGEARALTEMPKGASQPVWSPDGASIAFISDTLPKDFTAKKEDPPESDVRVITRGEYRDNDVGYVDASRPRHIWVVAVPRADIVAVDGAKAMDAPPKARQVTTGGFEEGRIAWSPDSARIYFVSDRVKESYYQPSDADLYSVDAKGGEIRRVASIDGPIHSYAISPDGKRVAFVGEIDAGDGVVQRSYSEPDLFVASIPADGGEPAAAKNLTEKYDFDIGGAVGGDQAAPRGGGGPMRPVWTPDGRSILVTSSEEGRVNLMRVDAAGGRVEAVTKGDHNLMAFSANSNASVVAGVISTPVNIGDLFAIDARTGEMKRLTAINGELFSQLNLAPPETVWYKSFDGRRIEAWVQRPPDFVAGKKYPFILDIHGGPHSAYGFTFDHEFQWMAAKGYVVLYPNPRGSTSYGQEFSNVIQYHYPGDDYKDLMAGVDEIVARGWADPEKLGVTGGSGGGLLTNWTIGHTNRFKAAVSQRSLADWRGFWYATDFSLFVPFWFRGAPWEQEADFKERSPITYIREVNTPLMLIEGEADLRTPPGEGGEQMFRALKYLKKPVVMVRFPEETHELSRSGKPVHRVERLDHIVGWFDKYLQGVDTHAYDVQ